MPTAVNIALTELTEDAFIAWILDTANNGLTITPKPRRFNQTKFADDDVTLNPITLPAITVEAQQGRAVHNLIPMYLMDVEVMLYMQADDTKQAQWDDLAESLESLFLVEQLAGFLTGEVEGFICGDPNGKGIVTRNMGRKEIADRHWKRSYRVQLWAGKNP